MKHEINASYTHGSRLTAHGSRLTAHGSRLTAHGYNSFRARGIFRGRG
ncbi:MAG TPA: hypothetical protein VFH95_08505 [Candidatus Kapabacteria bacterium]|nr:hypothetical protein [Candidatus Kapabacteria bacterium]